MSDVEWLCKQISKTDLLTKSLLYIDRQLETYSIVANFVRYEMHVGVWANYLTLAWSLFSSLKLYE